MQHRNGDLFTTDAKIIAHGANIRGVMGAGIAKTIKQKFPKTFQSYRHWTNSGLARPGDYHAVVDGDHLIVNLFTQDDPGPNASYQWVASSLLGFAGFMSLDKSKPAREAWGSTIAIPEIGSGIGGLQWQRVQVILGMVEYIYPKINFEVWHYEG